MEQIDKLNLILTSFKVRANCVNYQEIGNYFFYDLLLRPAAKIKDIQKYSDEISLALKAPHKFNCKVLHNEGIVRLEFAASQKKPLNLFSLLSETNNTNGAIPCLLGQKIDGSLMWMDLQENPHMIVAGTTGSGKSTLLHNIIANIIYFDSADLFLSDPKNIEFSPYEDLCQVAYSYEDTMFFINALIKLMDSRYEYLRSGKSSLTLRPQVLIIDEFANLIMQDKNDQFYSSLCYLAQKCRAANIHIILATQRPSAQIINGNIKANFPARIACKVANQVDSRIILDESGAENLSGKGDAYLKDNFRSMERFQVAYTSSQEIINFYDSNI
jgi:S-DNA-T family DNA segregation ATPase FtsK/SpoIIIE